MLDGKAIDLGALNQIMAHQLQQAIERQSSMVNESTVKKCPRSITDKDNECFKCKRNLKSRATWCDTGMHWIHYNCERLSEEEIRKIQAEPDSEAYTCKLCKSERENNKYITMSINEPEAQISTQITLPKTPHLTDVGSILQDELIGSEDNCHVCDSVINDAGVPCSDCKMIAHMKCSMNSDEETICLNCCAMNDQTQHEQAVSQVSVRQCHPTQSVQNIFISESQNKKQDICGQDLGTTIHVNVNKVITENAPTATATQELIKQTELNSVDISSEQKTVKQSELRQREQKLRKKEEELKIKEKVNSELQEERIWFKSYINKLETRVNELEKSNQLLRSQIKNCDQSINKPTLNGTHPPDATSILDRIQNRVTTMILNQVDRQFSKVEGILDSMDHSPELLKQTLSGNTADLSLNTSHGHSTAGTEPRVVNLESDNLELSNGHTVTRITDANQKSSNAHDETLLPSESSKHAVTNSMNCVSNQFAAICDESYVCHKYPMRSQTNGTVKSSTVQHKKQVQKSLNSTQREGVHRNSVQKSTITNTDNQSENTPNHNTPCASNNFLYRIPQRRISM